MEETGTKIYLKHKKYPIKSVTYKDICELKESVEKLTAWLDTLDMMKNFFEKYQKLPNKKKFMYEFQVISKIFEIFYDNYLSELDVLENQINDLKQREKIRVE